jgi:hypothetical protein
VIDLLTTTLSVLAEPPKNTGPDFGKASPLGLLVVVLLLIGVFLLVWSMNRHLKKLPKSFDDEPVDAEAAGPEPSDDAVGPTAESPEAPDTAPGKSASEPSG